MSETLPEDDGTMRINGITCRPDHMQPELLKELRDKCFESITARCAEIQLITEVLENDTV